MSKLLDGPLLTAFLEASRTGTFGIAAKNLGRSQPLLTHQIRRLEDIIGVRLFSRTPRGVTLTSKGTELLAYAQRIVAVGDDAIRHFAPEGAPNGRQFKVRLSEDLAGEALLNTLLAKTSLARSFDLEIVSSGEAPSAAAFERGEVDIFLGDLSPALSATIDPIRISAIRLVWAASPNFDPRRRPLPLGLYPAACTWRKQVIEAMDKALVDWFSAVESEGLAALQTAACSENVMIPCLPSSLARGLIALDYRTYGLPMPPKVDVAMYKARTKRSSAELDRLANSLWQTIFGTTL